MHPSQEYRTQDSCILLKEVPMTKVTLFSCFLLAACAAGGENQCRTGNWYEQGREEALLGNRSNAERYAQCAGFQERDYLAGWAIGYSEWNQRVSGSRM
jgi:hypothetical protein